MQYLPPMSEDGLRCHKGKRVCAVMRDGSRYYGTITDVRDGHLILNGPSNQNATINYHNQTKSKSKTTSKNSSIHSKTKSKTKGASVSAFYPGYGYGGYGFGYGGGLALSLGLLALLFLI